MFNLNLISLLLFISIYSINCSDQLPQNEPKINYHLKWVTNQTCYPIKLGIPIDPKEKNDSLVWDWIRSTDQSRVSKLPDVLKTYLVSETETRSSLYVLNYNNQTHEQLDGYEPKHIFNTQNGPKFIEKQRDLFALAYLKKHHIKAVKTSESIQVTCVADFLISNSLNEHSEPILRLMEKFASFKLAIRSANFPKKKIKSGKKPSDMFLFDSHNEKTPQQPKTQNLPPVQYQQHQPINGYPQQQQQQQPQNPVYYQPQPQTFYQQPIVNPYQAYQYFNPQESRIAHDQFVHDPHFNEMMEEYNNFVMRMNERNNALGYTRFDLKQIPQRTFVQPMERTYFDDYYFRFKRESDEKTVPKQDEVEEEDFDYDSTKFSKVRLSLGPVSIHKPFEKEEVVSCMLNLMNYDDVNLVYHSRIFKSIKTDEEVKKIEQLIPHQEFKSYQKAEENLFETDKKTIKEQEPVKQALTSSKPVEKKIEKQASHLMFLTDKADSVSFEQLFNGSNKHKFSPLFLIVSFIFFTILQF